MTHRDSSPGTKLPDGMHVMEPKTLAFAVSKWFLIYVIILVRRAHFFTELGQLYLTHKMIMNNYGAP